MRPTQVLQLRNKVPHGVANLKGMSKKDQSTIFRSDDQACISTASPRISPYLH